MATRLLLFFLVSLPALAQSTISSYYGGLSEGGPVDGVSSRSYTIVVSGPELDHSVTGANANWNFNSLVFAGTAHYNNTPVTPQDLALYPNSQMVTAISTQIEPENAIEQFLYSNYFTITALTNPDMTLNFSANNAYIGAFAYGDYHSDTVGGTYSYGTYSGTFEGTLVSEVDAFGILSSNDVGFGSQQFEVTRLKTTQTLNLSYAIFGVVGSVTQTSWHYYRAGDMFPYFKTTTTAMSVPLLSINETTTLHEIATPAFLEINENNLASIRIAPNPVSDYLFVEDNSRIKSFDIYDTNGRFVLKVELSDTPADVSNLESGIYFARITTDGGSQIKKFVKK